MNNLKTAIVFLFILCSCKSGEQGRQKTLERPHAEEVQPSEAQLKQSVVLHIPESIKEIVLEHISEDELNNPDRWRIVEDKSNYWEMWQSYLKFSIRSAFYNAVWTGNIRLVREMLYHHGDFMISRGHTDIAVASRQNIEMVRMLLDAGFVFTGIDTDDLRRRHSDSFSERKFFTALAIFAAENDDPAVIQLLIDRGAEVTDFAVYWAAENGKGKNVRVLLEAGGNARARDDRRSGPRRKTALLAAAEKGDAESVSFLLASGAAADIEVVDTYMGWTPLLWAASGDSDECVALLLKAGANPEAVGMYEDLALRNAVIAGNERSVQLLLNSSAVNTVNTLSPDRELRALNAVMEAARRGHAKILQMLIEKGGDVNIGSGNIQNLTDIDNMYRHTNLITNGGWDFVGDARLSEGGQTALMLASTPECVEILLRSGADVNAKDNAGRNALLFQCYFSSGGEIVSLLINAGSYLYLDRDGGRTLLRLAAGNKEAIALLKAAGCRDDDPDAEAEYSFYSYMAN